MSTIVDGNTLGINFRFFVNTTSDFYMSGKRLFKYFDKINESTLIVMIYL